MKTFLKITGVVAGVIVLILIIALKKVDDAPYFYSDYYTSTRGRFDSLAGVLKPEKGRVMVGFGRAGITPGLNAATDDPVHGDFKVVPLAGYGARKGKPAEGIHDSVFVKAMAIKSGNDMIVMVGADMLIIPPVLSEGVSRKVRQDLGLSRNQLFFSATHTHSSVGAWSSGFVGKQFAGEENPAVVEWLIQQFSLAVEKAYQDLQPGEIGSGTFNAPDLVRNRLIGDLGTKDPAFVFLIAKQDNGRKAVVGAFDAHATTLGDWNMEVSGDYPGYWERKVEKAGTDMALFFAGSVGSHGPVSRGEKFEKPQYLGETLADSVLKYIPVTTLQDSIVLASISLKMDLPEFHVRVSDEKRVAPYLAGKLFPDIGDAYIQGARIGRLIWITTPCDFSGEMAIRYKNAVCPSGFNAVVTSFNGAYVGYVIPGKYYHLNKYESRLMSWFGPYMGPYFDEMITRITTQLTTRP